MKTTLICLALLLGSRLGLPAEEPQLVQTMTAKFFCGATQVTQKFIVLKPA